MNRTRRFASLVSLLVAVLMLVTAGVASGEAQKPEVPFEEAGATLRVATMDNWFAAKSYSQNLPVYEALEEITGIKIEWEVIPIDDYATVMGTRLAAGTDLPDLFVIPWGTNADKLGMDGITIPLNDLIDEHGYYLNMLMEAYPVVRSGITSADGNIYAYPGFGEGFVTNSAEMESGELTHPGANICPNIPIIRQDWLDTLGLEMPATADDWYNVLTAFKNDDPNGNGKADEIPISPTFGVGDLYRFGEAFGLYRAGNAETRWGLDDEGKVFFKDTDPRFKETLQFLNKLYSEGLIDPEFATASYSKTTEKINRDLIGALASDWASNMSTYNANLRNGGVENANWVPVRPLENPDGETLLVNRWSVWKTMAISVDCENPELAMKWIDFHTLSMQGIDLQMFGIEGLSYTVDENGQKTLTEMATNNPDGISAQEYLRSLGGWGQLSHPQTKEGYEVLWADQPDTLAFASTFSADEIVAPFPGTLPFTEDETDVRSEVETTIFTYCGEMAVKFIEGKESFDNWDEYVSTVESYGMDRLLEVYQSAYERFTGE